MNTWFSTGLRSIGAVVAIASVVGCSDTGLEPELPSFARGGVISDTPAALQMDLSQARMATARFHRVESALEAGYVAPPLHECVVNPVTGHGMGYHYVNESLLVDPTVDISQPEALLYEPMKNGKLRLVGVEYVWLGPESADPPTIYGRSLQWNPFLGFWALHVWLWRNNPTDMFADFNPAVSCDYAPAPEA